MLPITNIGPIAMQTGGLIYLISFWIAWTFTEKHASSYEVQRRKIDLMIFIMLLAGILGARIIYIIRFPQAFIPNYWSIFSPSPQLLDAGAGLFVAILSGVIYAYRNKIHLWSILDIFTPGLMVLSSGLAIARLATGNGYGLPTNLPWGIDLWGEHRHPTQIYDFLAAITILVALWPRHKLKIGTWYPGTYFLLFHASTMFSWSILAAFWAEGIEIVDGLRLSQLAAWAGLAISLLMLKSRIKPPLDQKANSHMERK